LYRANKHQRPLFNGEWDSSNQDMMHFAMHRHRKGINALYFDGSARYRKARDLWFHPWHRTYDVNSSTMQSASYFPTWMR
jgi:prepilin-type processing-associated H-X9-DG protein